MKAKLTLSIEKPLVRAGKALRGRRALSLSRVIEETLDSLHVSEEPLFADRHCFTGAFHFDKGIDPVCITCVADIHGYAKPGASDAINERQIVAQLRHSRYVLNCELYFRAIKLFYQLTNSSFRTIICVEMSHKKGSTHFLCHTSRRYGFFYHRSTHFFIRAVIR